MAYDPYEEVAELSVENEDLRAKLEIAEKALVPFAQAADQCERDNDGTSVFINVTRLRDARSALAAIREGRE